MIPAILVKIALIIIMVRCVYVAVTELNGFPKHWFDILFYLSVALVALSYYLQRFHRLF